VTHLARRSLVRRIRRSLKRRGFAGTVGVAARDLRYYLFIFGPRYVRESIFDAVHGVDTRGVVRHAPNRPEEAYQFALNYQASLWRPFRALLESLDLVYEKFTFIDIGCGKGRTLLLAAEVPFRRVIGVELSDELAGIARRNAESYRGRDLRSPIEVVAVDAAAYDFPPEPSLVYMYNPLKRQAMARVVANLERSLESAPRAVLVCYANPESRELFDDSPAFELVSAAEKHVIYEARHPCAGTASEAGAGGS
jgi:SAM-dependent methyltransferase